VYSVENGPNLHKRTTRTTFMCKHLSNTVLMY